MAAGNQAKPRSFRDIRQGHPGSKMTAIDFTAGDLVVVMGIAESGWKFKVAIVAVGTLMIFVTRLRRNHLGKIAMKQPRRPHRQSGNDPDNLRVTVILLEKDIPTEYGPDASYTAPSGDIPALAASAASNMVSQ